MEINAMKKLRHFTKFLVWFRIRFPWKNTLTRCRLYSYIKLCAFIRSKRIRWYFAVFNLSQINLSLKWIKTIFCRYWPFKQTVDCSIDIRSMLQCVWVCVLSKLQMILARFFWPQHFWLDNIFPRHCLCNAIDLVIILLTTSNLLWPMRDSKATLKRLRTTSFFNFYGTNYGRHLWEMSFKIWIYG